jgi:hypothetical protein
VSLSVAFCRFALPCGRGVSLYPLPLRLDNSSLICRISYSFFRPRRVNGTLSLSTATAQTTLALASHLSRYPLLIVVGPGLGKTHELASFLHHFFSSARQKVCPAFVVSHRVGSALRFLMS